MKTKETKPAATPKVAPKQPATTPVKGSTTPKAQDKPAKQAPRR